jgi:hypothetical protein
LCARALKAQSPELEKIMKELREAITQHIGFARAMASHVLEHVPADPTQEGKPSGSWKKTA